MKKLNTLPLLILMLFLLATGCGNSKLMPVTTKKPEQLPRFTYQTMDGADYTNENLNQDKHTVLIYLDPECIFCQTAIQRFKRNMSSFENVQFVIVSVHSKNDLEKFSELHEIDKEPQMLILRDRKNDFARNFYVENYPVLYLYSKNGKFIKDFQGLTDIDQVEEAFNRYEANLKK